MNDSNLRKRFLKQGYIAPLPILSPTGVQRHLKRINAFLTAFDQTPGWKNEYLLSQLHHSCDWAYELSTADATLKVVSTIIGADVAVWDVSLFRKSPGDGPSWWHQDAFPLTIDVKHFASIWLAMTPCHALDGGLAMLPGYHLDGRHPAFMERSVESLLFTGHEMRLAETRRKVRDIVLEPGEAALLHPWLLHKSYPNRSFTPRIGVVLRYVRGSIAKLPSFVRRPRDLDPPVPIPLKELLLAHAPHATALKAVIESGFRSVMEREYKRSKIP